MRFGERISPSGTLTAAQKVLQPRWKKKKKPGTEKVLVGTQLLSPLATARVVSKLPRHLFLNGYGSLPLQVLVDVVVAVVAGQSHQDARSTAALPLATQAAVADAAAQRAGPGLRENGQN